MLFLSLLVIHVASGFIALISGLGAMGSRKAASGLHAQAGNVFCLSMSAMTVSAAILTAWEPDRLTLGAAIWTFYLVHSARSAARQRSEALSRGAMADRRGNVRGAAFPPRRSVGAGLAKG
jgi:hypothetical protein